jgi:NADH-quinone oxidoreductase subunit N/multicomponent Na+:H+ antiporter subunit D
MLSALLFIVLVLSLIGIPPLPGFWAKFLLVKGALGIENGWYHIAIAVVLIATVIETAYFLRIVRFMFQEKTPQTADKPYKCDLVPAFSLFALFFISLFMVGLIGKSLTAIAEEAADRKAYIDKTLPSEKANGK